MKSAEFSRRDLFTLPLRYLNNQEKDQKASFNGGIVKIPLPPECPQEKVEPFSLLTMAALRAGDLGLSRRKLLGVGAAVAGASVMNSRVRIAEAGEYKIEFNPFFRRANGEQSRPWNPLDPRNGGLINTGRMPGGAFDKYDQLDRIINGERARSSYWIPTSEWHKQIADSVVTEINYVQAGFCLYAAAASLYGPWIDDGITISGVDFTKFEREQIATMYYGGMKREPFYAEISPDVVGYVAGTLLPNGVRVVANYYPTPDQDWWGGIVDVSTDGRFLVTKPMNHKDGNQAWNRAHYDPFELRQMAVLNSATFQPGEEGAFVFIDKLVGGLIIGTHQLAS